VSSQDPQYEPPAVEEVPSQDGPAVTAAGDSPPPYGAITLMDDGGRKPGRLARLRHRVTRRTGSRG
jgi:hypothetical protein